MRLIQIAPAFLIGLLLNVTAELENISPIPVVKFAWDLPIPEDNVVGYRMHFGRKSAEYTKILDLGMVEKQFEEDGTGAMYSGPVEFEPDETGTWFTAVTAYNGSGLESDYSNEISFTIAEPPSPPGKFRVQYTTEVSSNLEEWEPVAITVRELGEKGFVRTKIEVIEPEK